MINVVIKNRYAAFFRLTIMDGISGELKKDTGWFPNLITNEGLDWFGGGAPNFNTSIGVPLATHCGVGLSNTLPTFADTQLNRILSFRSKSGHLTLLKSNKLPQQGMPTLTTHIGSHLLVNIVHHFLELRILYP